MFQLDGDEFGVASAVHAWVDPGSLIHKGCPPPPLDLDPRLHFSRLLSPTSGKNWRSERKMRARRAAGRAYNGRWMREAVCAPKAAPSSSILRDRRRWSTASLLGDFRALDLDRSVRGTRAGGHRLQDRPLIVASGSPCNYARMRCKQPRDRRSPLSVCHCRGNWRRNPIVHVAVVGPEPCARNAIGLSGHSPRPDVGGHRDGPGSPANRSHPHLAGSRQRPSIPDLVTVGDFSSTPGRCPGRRWRMRSRDGAGRRGARRLRAAEPLLDGRAESRPRVGSAADPLERRPFEGEVNCTVDRRGYWSADQGQTSSTPRHVSSVEYQGSHHRTGVGGGGRY